MNHPFTNFDCDIFFDPSKSSRGTFSYTNASSYQNVPLLQPNEPKEQIDIEYINKETTILEQQDSQSLANLGNISKKIFLDHCISPISAFHSNSDDNSSPLNYVETHSNHSALDSSHSSGNFDNFKMNSISQEDTNESVLKNYCSVQPTESDKNSICKKKAKGKVRRKAWKPEEDAQLLKLVEEYGTKWSKIASMLKGRTGKQIRDRYLNNLNPDILEKEWTKEEDNLILFLYFHWGKKWSKIAAALPGRSEGQVKNRFHWGLKRKILNSQFANYNPVQLVTHKNLFGHQEPIGETNIIPRIDLPSLVPKIDPNVYFDYPMEKNNGNRLQDNAYDQVTNPDDFISYNNNNTDEKIDMMKFLSNFSTN